MYSDTFKISHTISLFSSLENGNKILQELGVKLHQNKFIFITSENFERKVCKELGWIAVRSLLNLSAQLDNTNSGQPITK